MNMMISAMRGHRRGERASQILDLLAVLHDDEVARRLGVEVAELHDVRVAQEVHEPGLVQRVRGGGRAVLVAEARDLLGDVVPARAEGVCAPCARMLAGGADARVWMRARVRTGRRIVRRRGTPCRRRRLRAHG